MNDHDREHVREIIRGTGDWFGAALIRLIAKADRENKQRLHRVYPTEVEVVHHAITGRKWK